MAPANINLMATIIKDKKADGYIGFINKIPAAVTQGKTIEDVKAGLAIALKAVLVHQIGIYGEDSLNDLDDDSDVINETISLQLA